MPRRHRYDHALDTLPKNARLVFEDLARAAAPATAYEILERLRPQGVAAPPTVYRALNQLMERGIVHRLESLNAFVACAHPRHGEGTAFAICHDCGIVEEFVDDDINEALGALAGRKGFALDHATIELSVLCAACRSGQPGATG
jgi:Fur family transcriptional regulator, zinc uptake regulator